MSKSSEEPAIPALAAADVRKQISEPDESETSASKPQSKRVSLSVLAFMLTCLLMTSALAYYVWEVIKQAR